MKYILKIFIVLMISLSTSACFDNLYHLQISAVQSPDPSKLRSTKPECVYDEISMDSYYNSYTEGLFDLEYNKLENNSTHLYGYSMRLVVFNIYSEKAEENINTIQVEKAIVKIYDERNALINQEEIITDFIVTPQNAASIPVRIFNSVPDWELDLSGTPDSSIEPLYSYLYDYTTQELSTQYVLVDVVLTGKTLSGVEVQSDHFKFKINLCLGCLNEFPLCPEKYSPAIVCQAQDHSRKCVKVE